MRPVLFTVRGVRVWSYPALLYAGLVCGFYVMYLVAPRFAISRDRAALALLILFVPALLGARLWFVLDHWDTYRTARRRIWRRSEGGLALYGGLMLALLVSPTLLKVMGVAFAGFWDAATFTMLVAMVFTRAGCLLNGCCAGRCTESALAIRMPGPSGRWERRYPVPVLEAVAAVVLLLTAVVPLTLNAPRGTIFLFGLAGYALARRGLDRFREPPTGGRCTHALALAIFSAGSIVLFAVGWLATGG